MDKREFLVAYDEINLGPGHWGIVNARSEDEIRARYPELRVVHQRPATMSDEQFELLRDLEWHDIDGSPWGILATVLEDRETLLSYEQRVASFRRWFAGKGLSFQTWVDEHDDGTRFRWVDLFDARTGRAVAHQFVHAQGGFEVLEKAQAALVSGALDQSSDGQIHRGNSVLGDD